MDAGPIVAALLIHGAGGGAWEWDIWRAVFAARGLDPLCPDLGHSPQGLASTTLDDYVRQARTALASLPRPRAVIGASLGGLIAAMIADDADRLILVNPVPPSPWHARLPRREWPRVVRWHTEARLATTRDALPDADDATALRAYRQWRDESGTALRTAHAGVEVARPDIPTLCILSGQDADVPWASGEALAMAWQSDVIRVPAASHVGPLLGRQAASIASRAVAWLSAG